MFPQTPDTHPSRQVERIREILVGRQLEGVERRLEKLENRVPPLPTTPEGDVFMLCLEVFEKRHNIELQEIRDGLAASENQHAQAIHRLAAQIQNVAKSRTPDPAPMQQQQAEFQQRVATWLQNWQTGFNDHYQQRESWLIGEFRGELQKMRAWITSELTARDNRPAEKNPVVHESLTRLAAAARELAESAAALHGGGNPSPTPAAAAVAP